jgi:O-methyltransferase
MDKQHFINIAGSGNTAIPPWKLDFLWEAVVSCPVGDIVEIGCWRGGSSLVISASAVDHKPDANIYICDTFKGIALAGPNDNHHKDGDFSNTSKEHVNNLLTSNNISRFNLVEGIFPIETADQVNTKTIALLHIDVDVYEGYKLILNWAQDKLVLNAIVIFDDYSSAGCLGARQAVDEYLAGRSDFEMHLRASDLVDPDDGRNTSWAKYIG